MFLCFVFTKYFCIFVSNKYKKIMAKGSGGTRSGNSMSPKGGNSGNVVKKADHKELVGFKIGVTGSYTTNLLEREIYGRNFVKGGSTNGTNFSISASNSDIKSFARDYRAIERMGQKARTQIAKAKSNTEVTQIRESYNKSVDSYIKKRKK